MEIENEFEMVAVVIAIIYLYLGVIFLHVVEYIRALLSITHDTKDLGVNVFERFLCIFLWIGIVIWGLWTKEKPVLE